MIDAQSMENIENIDKHLKLAPLLPGGDLKNFYLLARSKHFWCVPLRKTWEDEQSPIITPPPSPPQ